jgi:magnesium-transporting ATPase (P-type)
VNFNDESYFRLLEEPRSEVSEKVEQALSMLALCNDVMVDEGVLSASSPDELALVNFASYSGVELLSRSSDGKATISR